jgi:UDP-N-acetylglucosamine 1-carboxyvinyltransferase
MDRIRIVGGGCLNGVIPISGAKNAALPLMIASLLTDQPLELENVPRLADVTSLMRILANHGVDYSVSGRRPGQSSEAGRTIRMQAGTIVDTCAPYELVAKMRASFWVIAPLLARMGEARVSLPGGCAIGTRPVDLLLSALQQLGADISIDRGYAVAKAPQGLRGADITFSKVTVGGTHVALMAATLARGTTVLRNAAQEPEVGDLAKCLRKMGARIEGIGTSTLTIEGVASLHGARHSVLPDRIEAGTYAMAAAMTGGNVLLDGVSPDVLPCALETLEAAGVNVERQTNAIRISRDVNQPLAPLNITTEPFPGFPTDLQAQLMALLLHADGVSVLRETIFENRFMHVGELARLGADIRLDGDRAFVHGKASLKGAPVMATDLRASVSLVIAGLVAEGETVINRVYHLDRGFEALELKLQRCGANVERLTGG